MFNKIRALISFFLFPLIASAISPQSIFLKEKQPSDFIQQLLILDGQYDPNDSLQQIVEKMQKNWIAVLKGKNQIERIDLVDSPARKEIREKVIQLSRNVGLFDAKIPEQKQYTYAVCIGGFLPGVRARLFELVKAWNEGYRFENLVFLTGDRKLRKGENDPDNFEDLCDPNKSPLSFKKDWFPSTDAYETEFDMVKQVLEQIELPKEMAEALEKNVLFVNAIGSEGLRPSLKETSKEWLEKYHPFPGNIFLPNRPIVWIYQEITLAKVMGEDFPIETIAPNINETEIEKNKAIVSIIFDCIAKSMFELADKSD